MLTSNKNTLFSGKTTNTASDAVAWEAGECRNVLGVLVSGTFDSATVTLQVSLDGGTTYVDTTYALTAAGIRNVELPYPCHWRLNVSGGGASMSITCIYAIGS
jgi:hypothetical protein